MARSLNISIAAAVVALLTWPMLASGQDTLSVDGDTLISTERSPLENVRYERGGESAPPSGIARVRQRISQIRGEPQPTQAATSAQPIIIVTEGQTQTAEDGMAQVRPQTILIPGADGVYRPLGGLGGYQLFDDGEQFRVRVQERPRLAIEVPSEEPPAEELEEQEVAEPEVVELLDLLPGAVPPAEEPDVPIAEVPEVISTDPTVREVERAILEAGLFRGLGVNFEFDRSNLLPEASRTLDAVGDVLRRYPDIQIEIAGHTDNIGQAEYNRELSLRRAEAVVDYLIEHFDIAGARLQPRGYGEDEPFTSNTTEAGRALNRRVEFRVMNGDSSIHVPMEAPGVDEDRLRELLREVVREELDRRGNE